MKRVINIVLILMMLCNTCLNSFGQTIHIHSITKDRQPFASGGYTLDHINMQHSRAKLLNPTNFSDSGIYKKNIQIQSAYESSGSLEYITQIDSVDIFFFGAFYLENDSSILFTQSEIDSLYKWSKNGGKMIIAEQPSFDTIERWINLGKKWGYHLSRLDSSSDLITSHQLVSTESGRSTRIYNGPFGELDTAYQGGPRQGYIKVDHTNYVTLAKDIFGLSTLIFDCNTMDLIIADVDAYTSVSSFINDDQYNITEGPEINNNQDKFWANTIAFMDSLEPFPPPRMHFDGTNLEVDEYHSYQWIHNFDTIEASDNKDLVPDQDGYYRVVVESELGCRDTSNLFAFNPPDEPLINCPGDRFVSTNSHQNYATLSLTPPEVLDSDGIATISSNAPDTFNMGSTEVTWTATDSVSFVSNCMYDVIVIDTEKPRVINLNDTTLYSEPGQDYATFSVNTPDFIDNHRVASITHDAEETLPIGTTVVNWTATDSSGNAVTVEQLVRVVDKEVPTIDCPSDITTTTDIGVDYAAIDLGQPIANDNDAIVSTGNNAPELFEIGTTNVTWSVADNSGNLATCEQTVTVSDVEAPTINCPDDITVGNDVNKDFASLKLDTPLVTDNHQIISMQNNAPEPFPVGSTTITWKATDQSGNTTSCEQEVTVINYNDITIPNVITPNGDGKNDYLVIDKLPENARLMIFDRSNQVVFRSDNYQNQWNGQDEKGYSLASGTYWYVMSSGYGEQSGFVVIKRE